MITFALGLIFPFFFLLGGVCLRQCVVGSVGHFEQFSPHSASRPCFSFPDFITEGSLLLIPTLGSTDPVALGHCDLLQQFMSDRLARRSKSSNTIKHQM